MSTTVAHVFPELQTSFSQPAAMTPLMPRTTIKYLCLGPWLKIIKSLPLPLTLPTKYECVQLKLDAIMLAPLAHFCYLQGGPNVLPTPYFD